MHAMPGNASDFDNKDAAALSSLIMLYIERKVECVWIAGNPKKIFPYKDDLLRFRPCSLFTLYLFTNPNLRLLNSFGSPMVHT